MTHRTIVLLLTFGLGATAACSSSSKQTEPDDTEATSSTTQSPASTSESEAATNEEQADKPPVFEIEELIGSEIQDTMPRGCPRKWEKLKGRKFEGELYACDGFQAPHRYEEPTVIIGIEEGKIRRVNLQSFHEPGDGIARMYDEVTEDFQTRCDRDGGGGGRMALDCGDYLVDISMQREGGVLNIVYGLENWDMPY